MEIGKEFAWAPGIPEGWRDTVVRGDLLRLLLVLPDECVDAVVVDPPYSSGGMFRGDRACSSVREKYQSSETRVHYPEFMGDTRDQRGYHYWMSLWLAECWRVAKSSAPVLVFSDWRQLPVVSDALQAGGWVWRGIVVWDKTEAVRPQMGRFRQQAEFILWGSKGAWRRNAGEPVPGVMRQVVKPCEKAHITAKPLEVMRWLLRVCPAGGVVLDPCAGSGTTGRAALEVGMHFVGFELSPDYSETAAQAVSIVQPDLEGLRR